MKIAGIYILLGLFTVALYFGMNALGQWTEPKVIHHEQEAAHCYTAGKMFFVSIACVPKVEPSRQVAG